MTPQTNSKPLFALMPPLADGFQTQFLGELNLDHDGQLLVGDPFRDFVRKGNPFVQLPKGRWPVHATFTNEGDKKTLHCISLVIDQDLLVVRQRWQARRLERGGDGSIPMGYLDPFTHDPDENGELECMSGHGAVIAKHDFEEGMPPVMPGAGWFEMLFANGVEGSWFDRVDRAATERDGIAQIPLPLNGKPLIVFPCHSQMTVLKEHAFIPSDGPEAQYDLEGVDREIVERVNPLVAVHVLLSN